MRKFFGILLSIVVMPLILASLITASVTFWVTNRESMISAFTSEAFIEQISSDDAIYEMMEANVGEIEGIDPALVNMAIRAFVSPEFIKEQITSSINQVFDYIEGKVPTLSIHIDLSSIKSDIAALNQNDELLAKIPDSIIVLEPIDPLDDIPVMPYFLQPFIHEGNVKNATYVLIGITILFWCMTALIGGENGRERLLWMGWTAVLPAAAVLLMGIVLLSGLGNNLIQMGLHSTGIFFISNIPISKQSIIDVINSAGIIPLQTGLITTGGCAMAAGIGLIAWGAVTGKEKENSNA